MGVSVRVMNDAWAVVVGALVGAAASLGASALGLLPGLNPEDRADRIDRSARLRALLKEITSDLMAIALSPDNLDGREDRTAIRSKLLVTRVELASLLPRREQRMMQLYDACMEAANRNDDELRARAGALFSVGAASWIQGVGLSSDVHKGIKDLRADTRASVVAGSTSPQSIGEANEDGTDGLSTR